jgi:hypothetical protein
MFTMKAEPSPREPVIGEKSSAEIAGKSRYSNMT